MRPVDTVLVGLVSQTAHELSPRRLLLRFFRLSLILRFNFFLQLSKLLTYFVFSVLADHLYRAESAFRLPQLVIFLLRRAPLLQSLFPFSTAV